MLERALQYLYALANTYSRSKMRVRALQYLCALQIHVHAPKYLYAPYNSCTCSTLLQRHPSLCRSSAAGAGAPEHWRLYWSSSRLTITDYYCKIRFEGHSTQIGTRGDAPFDPSLQVFCGGRGHTSVLARRYGRQLLCQVPFISTCRFLNCHFCFVLWIFRS